MKISCIIVDDEPLALDILQDHIRRTPSLELVGRFTTGAEAAKMLGERPVDLAFLDIQMPGMSGIDIAKLIAGEDVVDGEAGVGGGTRVIFTTAFPQYAVEGFRVDALDYLLKPIGFADFTRAVGKAAEWFAIKRAAEKSAEASDTGLATPHKGARTLIVKSDYKQFVIPIDTIVYIEGIRDYIRIHTIDGRGVAGSVQTLMNLKTVEGMLPASRFARVHRSYIVNLDRVKRIERTHILFDDPALPTPVAIPISDTYKESFASRLAGRAL